MHQQDVRRVLKAADLIPETEGGPYGDWNGTLDQRQQPQLLEWRVLWFRACELFDAHWQYV